MTGRSAPPAIVFGTGAVALGVIIDLAAEKVPVVHVSTKEDDVALRSRWSDQKHVLPAGADIATAFEELLEEKRSDWAGGCLMPTNDPTVRAISQNLDRFTDRFVTPVIPWSRLRTVVNKAELYAAAASADIPVPAILSPGDLGDAAEWSRDVGFPVIVKPTETPVFFRAFGKKAFEIHDRDDLLVKLDEVRRRNIEVMVSEIIPGEVGNLKAYRAYCDRHGEIIAEMYSEKICNHPPDYGVGIVQRTIPAHDELQQLGRRLTQALELTGYATTEFKLDPRDKKFKLMEINPRPAMVQRMFRAAGINFAHLTYLDCTGQALQSSYRYDPDVYCIYNTHYLHYLVRAFKKGVPGIRDYFAPYFKRRKALLVPPILDPAPFLFDLSKMIRNKLNRLANPNPATTQASASSITRGSKT